MECWLELVSVSNGLVHLVGHNVFTATGEVVIASSELRFRSLAELTTSLITAGFTVEQVYGDWNGGPFVNTSPVMVFIAHRNQGNLESANRLDLPAIGLVAARRG